ncbi:MAG: stage II sporulation protein M [Crocinitomicaceae bacterium]|nr:MAG: stage II sporulation protein M [Crocinitomicaceae bacterium]
MKETSFIAQNKEKWDRFEKLSESDVRDPGELSELFMDITDDLSYAQTFYKRRTVRVYLNQLAQRIFTGVHIQRRETLKKLITVWRVSLPIEIYKARKNLLFALVVFLIWATLSAVTTHYFPDFAKLNLSEGYMQMTNENIESGDPLAVYKGQGQFEMFVGITMNNVRVAFLTFIFGIFFTVGTHIFLFKNGMMLGSFQYFFASKGLFVTSFLGIWIHGAFEISAIVLAGGAGITLGNGWLFPGSYSRLQSLQFAAKSGLKIMLSLVPFFIFAGFLESYVTRNYQELPDWSKWFLIAFSFGIILFYYLIYPIVVARRHPELLVAKEVDVYAPPVRFELQKIRNFGLIISDSFRFYGRHFSTFFTFNALVIFPLILLIVSFQNTVYVEEMLTEHWFDWSKQLEIMTGYGFHHLQDWIAVALWSVVFSSMFVSVMYAFHSIETGFSWHTCFRFYQKKILRVWLGNLLLFVLIVSLPWYLLILCIALLPFVLLNGLVAGFSETTFATRFRNGWRFSAKSYGLSILNLLIFTFIFALFMQPIAFVGSIKQVFGSASLMDAAEVMMPDMLDLIADFVKNVANAFGGEGLFWANFSRQVIYGLFIIAVFPLWIISVVFLYLNIEERESAAGLRKAFQHFGKRKRFQENSSDFE